MKVSLKARNAATFAAGVLAGMMLLGAALSAARPGDAAPVEVRTALGGSSWAQTEHNAVQDLRRKGILVAPASYNGNAYVTRFEAAVLIDRFVKYVENGRKPLHPTKLSAARMPEIPAGPGHAAMLDLVANRYIVPNSSLIAAPSSTLVTAHEFSTSLEQAVVRIEDRDLAPQKVQ